MKIPSCTQENCTLPHHFSIWTIGVAVAIVACDVSLARLGLARELASAPAETSVVEPDSVQYYQDYQPLPAGVVPQPGSSAPVLPQSGATAVTAPMPDVPPGQPASLTEPIWVMPPAASPAAGTVPATATPAAPDRPTASPPQPASPTGIAVTVTDIQVVGGDAELQQIARNAISTQPGQAVTSAQLQQDAVQILNTGFFANAIVRTEANPQGINVVFQVEPIVVRSLQLSGAQALPIEVANALFQPQLGAPLNLAEVRQAVQRTNEWYAQNGYTLARVIGVQPSRDGSLTLSVAEGVVRDVRVRFLTPQGTTVDAEGRPIRVRTQPDFVRRQIKLQPGQPFRVDIARADLQRLAALGIFDTANVSFEGDARQTDVVYNVVEGRSRGFNFGGGFNDVLGLYGTVTYQDANFSGLAQKLNASVQVGTQDTQYSARFQSPYRDTDPNTPGYGANIFRRQGLSQVFDDEIKLPNGSRVRERRIGGGVNLDYPVFGPEWNTSLGLNYNNISLRDRDGDIFTEDRKGNPLSLSGKGIDDLYTLSFRAVRDRRDNPVNPGGGSVLSLSTEQSLPIGRGEILSNRLEANYSQYVPVDVFKSPEGERQFPEVVAFNVQGGTVIGDLPPYNAYLLGGPDSVRGYETGDVATSRSYFQVSTEYRFPIYRFIGGVVFADFATGLGSQDSVLGNPGGDRDKPGSGFGGGIGLRFNSPIGIIRADFGISDRGDTRLQFGFGQRF